MDPYEAYRRPGRPKPGRTGLQLPTIAGLVDPKVETVIRSIASFANELSVKVGAMGDPAAAASSALDPAILDQIRSALQTGGSHPLSVHALLGQPAKMIRVGTHDQRLAFNLASVANGLIFFETDRAALMIAVNQQWAFIANVPFACTLFPDTRPADLNLPDAGFVIHSTDFDRLYRWTGAVWTDVAGQPQREIVWIPTSIHALFEPTTGYQLCDGTANVRVSLPDATTVLITVPNLTSGDRFLRATAGATGGTGGSATTHTHDVTVASGTTGSPSGTTNVQAGGTAVASANHTHDNNAGQTVTSAGPSGTGGDDALPPYYYARPYLRL